MSILHRWANDNITVSESFRFKSKFLDNTNNAGIVNAKIAVPLKYLSNFWRTLEIPLINCQINFILPWSENCVISEGNRATTFSMTDPKFYQLKIIQNNYNNWNQDSKPIFGLVKWSKFSGSK